MSVIYMSVTAVPLIAAIAAIRFFAVYKLPKKTFYVMWNIVLYQLLIPFNLFARLNASGYIAALSVKLKEMFMKASETADVAVNIENPITTLDTTPSVFNNIFGTVDKLVTNIMTRTDDQFHLNISPLLLIWLAGFICLAAYFIFTHMRFRKIYSESLPIDSTFVRSWCVEYSDSMKRKVKIKQSDLINSPLTYGIFNPVILLPKTTNYNDEATLKYILIHEYTHIRRFDVLAKMLLATALCVHWFNPSAWLMYVLANRDIELSCDETVVRKSNIHLKSDYALTLLALEEKKSLLALGVGFGGNLVQERVKSIMKIHKKSKLRVLVAVILVGMVTVMFAALQSCKNDMGSADVIFESQELTTESEMGDNVESTEAPLLESIEYANHINEDSIFVKPNNEALKYGAWIYNGEPIIYGAWAYNGEPIMIDRISSSLMYNDELSVANGIVPSDAEEQAGLNEYCK